MHEGVTLPDVGQVFARLWGTVIASDGASVRIAGLSGLARLGDSVEINLPTENISGEIVALDDQHVTAVLNSSPNGLAAGLRAWLVQQAELRVSDDWLGSVLDAFGQRVDGTYPQAGAAKSSLCATPPRGDSRRQLGGRLSTGTAALDTMLPLCRGQRLGVFAGSGVGKSRLMADLALGVEADVVVVGLIGERGREMGEFVQTLRVKNGLSRAIIIGATSDQTALVKRRAAWLTLAVAEHFRDTGRHVLCLLDSVTRFAEAHREIALAAGEVPALRAFPPSTAPAIAALCERAGPGVESSKMGDITAIFTVLVAGSDMDEPVADMVRGVLDGHVVLERSIAERGRFPAIDVRRSVSRSAPAAWTETEEQLANEARRLIAAYEEAEPMIRAGLYVAGSDPTIDRAIEVWPLLDAFIGSSDAKNGTLASFQALAEILDHSASEPART